MLPFENRDTFSFNDGLAMVFNRSSLTWSILEIVISVPNGTPIGSVLNTNIRVFINNVEIMGYNINGDTYVIAEDLNAYGVSVRWNEAARTLSLNQGPSTTRPKPVPQNLARQSSIAFPYFATDIVTYIDGKQVTSYNIGGSTVVRIDDVAAAFGTINWDGANRILRATTDGAPSSAVNFYGNTAGNIHNLGYAAIQGDWIFYFNGNDDWKIYKMRADGTERQKLNDDSWSHYMNVVGDWIFYENWSVIYRMRTDGTQREKLSDDITKGSMIVAGDWIFYINGYERWKLYKMRTDGTDRQKLSDDYFTGIDIVGDWIYYTAELDVNRNKIHGIYRMRTDGTDVRKLSDDWSSSITVADGLIFYGNLSDGGKIYVMRTDGTGRRKLNDDRSYFTNVAGDWIFYSNWNDGMKIYRMRTDGTEKKKLNDDYDWSDYLNVAGGWIFYRNNGDHKMYMMRTDGTDRQLVQ
jgi:hypothetical protein